MELTMATFVDIRNLIQRHSGIYFPDNKKGVLQNRLAQRLRERNCPSFDEYCHLLKFDAWRDKELSAVFDLVTTRETYFYRDQPQLRAFMTVIIPAVMQANSASCRLRIWSAACSTGDEPYTLALMLMEEPALAKWQIEIRASDISEGSLYLARRRIYGQYAIRHVPERVLKKYFVVDGDQYTVSPKVNEVVRFTHLNLLDAARVRQVRGMDVIFCRNCLIYFDDKAKRKVVDLLYDCLNPGGYLVIGFSESLHAVSRAFRPISGNRSVVYQKI